MNSESYLYWLYLSIATGFLRCYLNLKDWKRYIFYGNYQYWRKQQFYYYLNKKLYSYEQYKHWVNGNAIYMDESS